MGDGMSLITIERHIVEQQKKHPQATGAFSGLLYDIALAAKIIARETTLAGLVNILGAANSSNVSGDQQQKLDVFANQTFISMCMSTGRLCVMASEESEDVIPVRD